MGFTKKEINGININESCNTLQWKIVSKGDDIIMLSYDNGTTGTIHKAYSSIDFIDIISYIDDNKLDVNSIYLHDKETFSNNALISGEDDNIINFIETLNFEDGDN